MRCWVAPLPYGIFAYLLLFLQISGVTSQDCSATKLCATGCCSKFGYCGIGSEFCEGLNCVSTCDFKSACDEKTPCAPGTGCCSKSGFCGLGPDYCAPEICVNNCDSKSYCNPGYGQTGYSEIETCPLNVCCSKYGYCGLTEEFCGIEPDRSPTCDNTQNIKRVIGYWEEWAANRPCHAFRPDDFHAGVYTHINLAFGMIDAVTFEVLPAGVDSVELYRRVTNLKFQDHELKVYLSLGGWTFNDPGPTATTFSDIVNNVANQQKFIKSLISFMSTYNFDGVDIDWEYPGAPDRNGRGSDFAAYPAFMANLKQSLRATGGRDGLTMAIPASYWYLQHFDIKKLAKAVDWFNIMTYDLHGAWDIKNIWTGPYLNAHTNLTEIKSSLDLLWRNDIDPKQVTLGFAFYGRSATVSSPSCVTPGCTYYSPGLAGPCSREAGILTNAEISDIIADKGLTPTLYSDAAVKVINWGDQWVAYDDQETYKLKADFARENCLGGVMVWAMTHDTVQGHSALALGRALRRPAVQAMSGNFLESTDPSVSYLLADGVQETLVSKKHCHWTGCAKVCGNGFAAMKRSDPRHREGELMLDSTFCGGNGVRTFCCPIETPAPTCGWWDHGGNGKCEGECPVNYIEVGSYSGDCNHGRHQQACCTYQHDRGGTTTKSDDNTVLDSMELFAMSHWKGNGQKGECDSTGCGSDHTVGWSISGSGGVKCSHREWALNGQFVYPAMVDLSYDYFRSLWQERIYCSSTNNATRRAWGTCTWNHGLGNNPFNGRDQDKFCRSDCPDGTIRAAMDDSKIQNKAVHEHEYLDCSKGGGGKALCCDATVNAIQKRGSSDSLLKNMLGTYIDTSICYNKGEARKSRRSLSLRSANETTTEVEVRQLTDSTCGEWSSNMLSTLKVFFNFKWDSAYNEFQADEAAYKRLVLAEWDRIVTTMFPNLNSTNLSAWTKTSIMVAQLGVQSVAEQLLKRPFSLNGLLGSSSLTESSCKADIPFSCSDEYPELCIEDDDDCDNYDFVETSLMSGIGIRALRPILKNGKLPHGKYRVGGKKNTPQAGRYAYMLQPEIIISAPPFYSSGAVPADNPLADRVYTLAEPSMASYPRLRRDNIARFPTPRIATEHIVELNTVSRFLNDRLSGTIQQVAGGTNVSRYPAWNVPTISQTLNSPVLSEALLNQRAPNRFTWMPASQRATPLTRILAIPGSKKDTQKQAMVSKEMNGRKCVIWTNREPIAPSVVNKTLLSRTGNPCNGIRQLNGVISVWEYLQTAEVSEQLISSLNLFREELAMAQIAYDLNNPNPAPEDVIHFVDTFDEWMAASIINMEETSRNIVNSAVTRMDALWTDISTRTADEGQRALAYTTLEHLDDMRHHADRINFPRINLGIRFPGSGNKA